jgi:L,D-transpeptidase ErfK/SrfK
MKYSMRVFLFFLCTSSYICSSHAVSTFDFLQNTEIVGKIETVETVYEDTLIDLARTHNLGFTEIVSANRSVNKWLPGEGTTVLLPKAFIIPSNYLKKGMTINLAEYRGFYADGEQLITFPVGIGRMDWSTPLGISKVDLKLENPSWYPPASVRQEHKAEGIYLAPVVPAGPDNPLGKLAMRLDIPGGYFIHGTNKPDGVGMQVSHGCIRLFPEDIKLIFSLTNIGLQVKIINEPYKIGIVGNQIFLEIHETLFPEDINKNYKTLQSMIEGFMTDRRVGSTIDWIKIREIFEKKTGVPMLIAEINTKTT